MCLILYLVKQIACNLRVKPRGYTPICVGNRSIVLREINRASCGNTHILLLCQIFFTIVLHFETFACINSREIENKRINKALR